LKGDIPLTRETFLAAIHPEDRENAITSFREALNADKSAAQDIRVVLPDDQVRWIRVQARLQPRNDGSANQVRGIFVDVTEQKAAEAQADLQRQEVAHLMRVSVVGELSGAIAHEINQPLTAIQSNAERDWTCLPRTRQTSSRFAMFSRILFTTTVGPVRSFSGSVIC
jgi:C4-dicarboxylate-specific signal transduction histidine kinase